MTRATYSLRWLRRFIIVLYGRETGSELSVTRTPLRVRLGTSYSEHLLLQI